MSNQAELERYASDEANPIADRLAALFEAHRLTVAQLGRCHQAWLRMRADRNRWREVASPTERSTR